ncbi:hypothetical protein [Flavobacterium hydatis]|uniref:Uncharacterized protein n=1 Tax=Flavobacterium hydatis TaxID=991 RepID=A0A086AKY3_FLAHY|nr:hypothetical protein [Flavobacterium hydatis]KFF17347.1 hypothetical protein IW20_08375 [Flavobacterium hydatis]OXA85033.1 hypothetical protein B0A62_24700 [Flavobacterium hydatis]
MIDLKKISRKIEKISCKEHNETPKAEVIGDSIKITSCCDTFQSQLTSHVKKEMKSQAEASARESINEILKKFKK